MFMTSNGLAPLILTPDAQGAKTNADGTPVAQPGPGPDNLPEDQGDKGKLAQKIASFVEKGDEEGLAKYLRSIEGSIAHE
jgi:hypothetical protein